MSSLNINSIIYIDGVKGVVIAKCHGYCYVWFGDYGDWYEIDED